MKNRLLRNTLIQQIQYSVAGTLQGAWNIAVNKSGPALLTKLAF